MTTATASVLAASRARQGLVYLLLLPPAVLAFAWFVGDPSVVRFAVTLAFAVPGSVFVAREVELRKRIEAGVDVSPTDARALASTATAK